MLKLYTIYIDRDLTSKEYFSLLYSISPEKIESINEYRNFKDRQRAVIGLTLARLAICRTMGLKYNELIITENEYGKPLESSCNFNISHSGKWVACVLSDKDVGVDVENIIEEGTNIEWFYDCFTIDEQKYVLNAKVNKAQIITKLWTIKESYIKAKGFGLSIPLNSVEIHITHDRIVYVTEGGFKEDYEFGIKKLEDSAYCSICSLARETQQRESYTMKTFLHLVHALLL